MKKELHRAEERGTVDGGWLESHHSFSFGEYHNPNRMGFGRLRVLNDDFIKAGKGFDTHPHRNMEIITIPLVGSVRHKDSEGNRYVVAAGEVQVMSAGSGIRHSEYNDSETETANFLQIWIHPRQQNSAPRYAQETFGLDSFTGNWRVLVSPLEDSTKSLKMDQAAYISRGVFEPGAISYKVHRANNGIFLFSISGEISLLDEDLGPRDAIAIEEAETLQINAKGKVDLLVLEVPMA